MSNPDQIQLGSPKLSEQPRVEYGLKEKTSSEDDSSDKPLFTVEAGYTDVTVELPRDEERRILRKADYRIVPLLATLYLIAFVDRTNIGNAKIAGMEESLNLTGMRYNAAVTMFFISYILLEVPANIILKLWRPSLWISVLLFSWGLVMTLMSLVHNYAGLLVARFFLGVAEAGFFPAAIYLLTLWYRRYELQKRLAWFFVASALAGAFSGILAYGIEGMDGIAGLEGWQWIFLLEGLVPVALSTFVWKFLPDTPEKARFLTKHEKEFIINRLAVETGSGHGRVTNADKLSSHHVWSALKQWKIWAAGLTTMSATIGMYGFLVTVPTVLEGLGYTSAVSQLLTVPIYVVEAIATLITAFWSERIQQRSPFIVAGFSIASVGFIAQLALPQTRLPGLTYAFLFPIASGLHLVSSQIAAWTVNNLAPSSKRAVGAALFTTVANLGGIAGSNIYIESQAPKYPTGYGVGLAMCVVGATMAVLLRVTYARENARRQRRLEEEGEEAIRARYGDQKLLEMGDLSPFFIYSL